jgi:hypothetical protein
MGFPRIGAAAVTVGVWILQTVLVIAIEIVLQRALGPLAPRRC